MYQIQVQTQRYQDYEKLIYLKYTNFREAQVSMIPYFIRLSERTGNDQESSSENTRSSNLNISQNLQVTLTSTWGLGSSELLRYIPS